MTDFTKLKKGTKVWSLLRGWGVIDCVDITPEYPVRVTFSQESATYSEQGVWAMRHTLPELYLTEQIISPAPREIDWRKIPVDTKVLVSDAGEEYSNRYFATYLPSAGAKFMAFMSGHTQDTATDCAPWIHCKLHPDVEVLEAWYL